MSSVSGLSADHRASARSRAVGAASLALAHRENVHYTQGARRGEGIARKLNYRQGEYPNYEDCSSFFRWCLYNGLYLPFHVRDTTTPGEPKVWSPNGYTGTLYQAGKIVRDWDNILAGDALLYGPKPGKHVALAISKTMCISHGSEGGPYKLSIHYRSDLSQVRRYI